MLRTLAIAALVATGCGGSSRAPDTASDSDEPETAPDAKSAKADSDIADSEQSEGDDEEDEPAPRTLPTTCKKKAEGVCIPPKAFVDRLCNDVYPNIALAMFAKGTPWTRGYLTRDTKAWNASGGAASDGMLKFDEEVLVLRHRAPPKGGVQISGMGGYDVLRWDGSCVTLATEEMTTRTPPKAGHAPVEWRLIQDPMREALRTSEAVTSVYRAQRKECKGVTMGSVSKKCEKLTNKLATTIVEHVRSGGSVAAPERMPE